VFNIVEDGAAPRVEILSHSRPGPVPAGEVVLFAAAVYDLGRSGIDPASVALTRNGKPIPADDPDTAGSEGYILTEGLLTHRFEELPKGKHVITLGVKDKAGNVAQSAVWSFETK